MKYARICKNNLPQLKGHWCWYLFSELLSVAMFVSSACFIAFFLIRENQIDIEEFTIRISNDGIFSYVRKILVHSLPSEGKCTQFQTKISGVEFGAAHATCDIVNNPWYLFSMSLCLIYYCLGIILAMYYLISSVILWCSKTCRK